MPARFQDIHFLGAGACGQVFRARDVELGRTVAVKLLAHQGSLEEEGLARFRREARIQASIEHPHVVRIFDAGLDEAAAFLVMELVQGVELERHLQIRGPLSPEQVLRLARELGSALDCLHQAGVTHRDLKPANVMLRDNDGSAVLMDLGLASRSRETALTRTGQVLGTPLYMAPEVILGKAGTAASDQYQLSLVLGEALTGARRVDGRTLGELAKRVVNGEFAPWPEGVAPAAFLAVLERGSRADPSERFASCGQLARVLAGEEAPPALSTSQNGPRLGPRSRAQVERLGPESEAGSAARVPSVSPASPLPPSGANLATTDFTGTPFRWMSWIRRGVLLAGLVATAYWLTPAPAPRQVEARVVGDCLVMDFDPAGARGVTLRVGNPPGEHPVEEEELEGGRRRLLVRSLPREEDLSVQLVWQGGEGPRAGYRAQDPLLDGAPRLAIGRKLEVTLTRPVEIGFETLEPQEAGSVLLPVPSSSPGTWPRLCWREAGIAFESPSTLAEVLRREADRFLVLMETMDPDSVQRIRSPEYVIHRQTRQEDPTEPLRSQLIPLQDWLPDLLRAIEEVEIGRRLWYLWQSWERSGLQGRAMENSGTLLVRHGEGVGLRSWGPVPPDRSPEGLLPLLPQEGGGEDPDFLLLTNSVGKLLGAGKFEASATAIHFRWPDHPRTPETVMALSVRVRKFEYYTQLHLSEVAPEGISFETWLWNPKPRIHGGKDMDTWATVTFPGSLAPAAGALMKLTAEDILTSRPLVTEIGGVRVFRVR